MARRVFFSFHYQRDVNRAMVARNSWVTKPDRGDAGFFDSSVFESKQRTSPEALRRFLDQGLVGCSVTCVLVGNQTAWRRWVRYEILRSFVDGKGLLAVSIHGIRDMRTRLTDSPGTNPLSCLGFSVEGSVLRFTEWDGQSRQWVWARDLGSMPLAEVCYPLGRMTAGNFAQLFPSYDYVANDGANQLGRWIESAAASAGR